MYIGLATAFHLTRHETFEISKRLFAGTFVKFRTQGTEQLWVNSYDWYGVEVSANTPDTVMALRPRAIATAAVARQKCFPMNSHFMALPPFSSRNFWMKHKLEHLCGLTRANSGNAAGHGINLPLQLWGQGPELAVFCVVPILFSKSEMVLILRKQIAQQRLEARAGEAQWRPRVVHSNVPKPFQYTARDMQFALSD
jgi:hypothetical protein